MRRNDGNICSPITEHYLQQKQYELSIYKDDLYACTEIVKKEKLIELTCTKLNLPIQNNLLDLALTINEDIAIMYNGYLTGICFCFPSSWLPAAKLGFSLAQIHEPVADNSILVNHSQKLSEIMSSKELGSFKRQVWTITANNKLSSHPNYNNKVPYSLDDLYFRLETQTTYPLIDKIASLFFVKVEVVKLQNIWDLYKIEIKDSINSMTDSILTYKNLHKVKQIINNMS